MKKLKKLIVALILGLFCGIGLIFGNRIVKADDNLNDYEVLADIDYNLQDSYNYFYITYNFVDYLSLININSFNLYGFYIKYEINDVNYEIISYFSSLNTNASGVNYLMISFNYRYFDSSYTLNRSNTNAFIYLIGSSSFSLSSLNKNYNNYNLINFQLIKYPSVIYTEEDVENAYNEGYENAKEEVVLKGSPLLNCQISVYDSDNMILGSEPINNNLITADSRLPASTLYDYATDYLNSGESGRIEIGFSIAITPNDKLQESINFTNGAYISEMFTSYNWVSSNRFVLEQNLINASKIVKDINLIPNLAMVSFTFDDVDNLEFLEYGIVSSYYDSIYNNGYDVGYDVGYDIGINQSKEENFELGYQAGYNAGLESDFSFGRELLKVASIPFNVLGQILSFEIFDINIWLLLCGILTICIVIWAIKKYRG